MRDPITLPALPAELRREKSWARGTDYYDVCGLYTICKSTVDGVSKFLPWYGHGTDKLMLTMRAFDTAQEARECAAKHAEGSHVRI